MKARRNKKLVGTSWQEEEVSNPLRQTYYFQNLPWDIQQLIFQGIRFRIDTSDLQEVIEKYGLDRVLDEEADHLINCHNYRRSIQEWLHFAETGE